MIVATADVVLVLVLAAVQTVSLSKFGYFGATVASRHLRACEVGEVAACLRCPQEVVAVDVQATGFAKLAVSAAGRVTVSIAWHHL